MNLKQGGYRNLPDGYLHLNNFAHSMKSGMAGAMFERMFTKKQQDTVEELLRELALSEMARQAVPEPLFHYKHGTYRFKKTFLLDNFKKMVYGYLRLIHKSASGLAAMAITGEIIELTQNGGIPQVRFK